METITGQVKVPVKLEDGTAAELTVSQLKLRKWDDAFKAYTESEFKFAAICCGVADEQIVSLEPDSYEQVRQVCESLNKGFLTSFVPRQNALVAERMGNASPAMLAIIKESLDKKALKDSIPGLRPQ